MRFGFGFAMRQRRGPNIADLIALLSPGATSLAVYNNTDPRTMWQNEARTLPVTELAQPVRVQDDLSGFNNHRIAPTDVARPLFNVNAQGRMGLNFNGTSSTMRTNTFTPGSDKCQIFGVWQKVGDTVGIIAELSANWTSNIGTFGFYSDTIWGTAARGAAAVNVGQQASVAASGENTAVLAITHDIAGDLSTIRRNGVAGTSGTADKGTGSFNANQIFFGMRGGTSVAWAGWSLAFEAYRFGPNLSAGQIAQIEALLNASAGGVF